ncbi:MAG: hypothetical protein EOP39_04315 [Rubrivivax sp.]|nr:MAG: hypothetical protein EOP39_04315 [Rubrivivax sp.]
MRTTPDPADAGPVLGAPIRPAAAPAPNPAAGFELGDWTKTLPEGLAEKPAEPPVTCRECIVETRYEAGQHREITADRWFFTGGPDEGYEIAEEAQEAWDALHPMGEV